MIRVVLDTNVLVSAMLTPFGNEAQALSAVRRGVLLPCLSRAILDEYAAVLARRKFGFEDAEIRALIEMLQEKGLFFEPAPATGLSPDPGDDDFIACALQAAADFIVTGNKKHFPEASCGKCRVVSARELTDLLPKILP
jgi:putative PIN family toxin of toxin-antitoxin system